MSVQLLNIYVVYDRTADQLGGVMLQALDAPAERAFMDAILDDKTNMSRHPDDYELLCIGSIQHDNSVRGDVRVVVRGSTVREFIEKRSLKES